MRTVSGYSRTMVVSCHHRAAVCGASNSQWGSRRYSRTGWFVGLLSDSRGLSHLRGTLRPNTFTANASHRADILSPGRIRQGNRHILTGALFTLGVLSWRVKYTKGKYFQLGLYSVPAVFSVLVCHGFIRYSLRRFSQRWMHTPDPDNFISLSSLGPLREQL